MELTGLGTCYSPRKLSSCDSHKAKGVRAERTVNSLMPTPLSSTSKTSRSSCVC